MSLKLRSNVLAPDRRRFILFRSAATSDVSTWLYEPHQKWLTISTILRDNGYTSWYRRIEWSTDSFCPPRTIKDLKARLRFELTIFGFVHLIKRTEWRSWELIKGRVLGVILRFVQDVFVGNRLSGLKNGSMVLFGNNPTFAIMSPVTGVESRVKSGFRFELKRATSVEPAYTCMALRFPRNVWDLTHEPVS